MIRKLYNCFINKIVEHVKEEFKKDIINELKIYRIRK